MNSILKPASSVAVGVVLSALPCCGSTAGADGTSAQASQAVSSITLHVEGMTCASCSAAVRTALKRLDGVRDARVSVEDKRAVVDYEPAKVTPQQMVEAVNNLGYRASAAPQAAGDKGDR